MSRWFLEKFNHAIRVGEEKNGRSIKNPIESAHNPLTPTSMGLPPPQFREISEFVVTFSKAPVTASAPISSSSETLWDTETRQLTTTADEPLLLEQERRMQQAMQYVREHGVITNAVYRKLTSVSEATARRDLEALVERGALRGPGKTRGRQYRLP